MSKEHSQFSYRSPKIKQLFGFSYILVASAIFYFREQNPAPTPFIDKILILAILMIGLLGVFQCLSYSICLFDSHQPRALKKTFLFGVYETKTQMEFDLVKPFPNYNLTGLWGVHLSLSEDKLKEKFSEEERALMKKGYMDTPSLIVIDSIKRDRAKKIITELQEFYQLSSDEASSPKSKDI